MRGNGGTVEVFGQETSPTILFLRTSQPGDAGVTILASEGMDGGVLDL